MRTPPEPALCARAEHVIVPVQRLTLSMIHCRLTTSQGSLVCAKSRASGDAWTAAAYRQEALDALALMVCMCAWLHIALGALRSRSSCERTTQRGEKFGGLRVRLYRIVMLCTRPRHMVCSSTPLHMMLRCCGSEFCDFKTHL